MAEVEIVPTPICQLMKLQVRIPFSRKSMLLAPISKLNLLKELSAVKFSTVDALGIRLEIWRKTKLLLTLTLRASQFFCFRISLMPTLPRWFTAVIGVLEFVVVAPRMILILVIGTPWCFLIELLVVGLVPPARHDGTRLGRMLAKITLSRNKIASDWKQYKKYPTL